MCGRFSLRRWPPLLAKHNHKRMSYRWSTRWCLVGQCLTADGLILQLNFCQLVHQLWCVRAFYNPRGRSKRQLENKVGEKGLWVKIPVIGQKIVVQLDAVFVAENSVQNLCSFHIRFIFVTSVLANLTKFFALGSLQKHIIAVNNWKEKILVNF